MMTDIVTLSQECPKSPTTIKPPSLPLPASLSYELAEWKEPITLFYDILIWRKKYNPHFIFAAITATFIIHSYFEIPILTSLALAVLEVALIDFYMTHNKSRRLFSTWTADHQQRYEKACESLDKMKASYRTCKQFLYDTKLSSPRLYAGMVFGGLILLAYLGSVFSNTFVLYLMALGLGLAPGLIHHGILQKQFGKFFKEIKMVINKKMGGSDKQQ